MQSFTPFRKSVPAWSNVHAVKLVKHAAIDLIQEGVQFCLFIFHYPEVQLFLIRFSATVLIFLFLFK